MAMPGLEGGFRIYSNFLMGLGAGCVKIPRNDREIPLHDLEIPVKFVKFVGGAPHLRLSAGTPCSQEEPGKKPMISCCVVSCAGILCAVYVKHSNVYIRAALPSNGP